MPFFFTTATSSDLSYRLNGYIGTYGNADPLDISQWQEINIESPTAASTRNWDDASGVCSNMYSGMHIEFLIAKTGEKLVPQNKIVATSISYTTNDWRTPVDPDDDVTAYTFSLGLTVSFIYTAKSEVIGYVPPPPPVLFKVPYDVFYPFVLTSAAPRAAPSSLFSLLMAITVTICMIVFVAPSN